MQYFRKELPQRTLITPKGEAVTVQFLGDGVGAIVTDDPELQEWLATIVGTQGLSRITKKEYDELKKKTRLDNLKLSLAAGAKPKPPGHPRPNPKLTERKKCRSCGGR